MLQACQLYFDSKKIKIGEEDIRIQLDLSQFFEFYKVINAKALAERIGMHQSLLAQYIRGIKKPSAQQTERIFQGIRSVGRELSRLEIRLRN
jgi:transcriptional regulator with XRE-family HTH domain